MTIDDIISDLHKSVGVKHDVGMFFDTESAEQLLYWLTEYKAMISGRHSDNLSERLAEHLVWAESNSYECPITLAEDLQETISVFAAANKVIEAHDNKIAELEAVIYGMDAEIKRLQSVRSWHSCDEKPQERITYLVSDGYCVYFGFYDVFKHKWVTNEDTDGNSLLYWMEIPKPQPPKEVTE